MIYEDYYSIENGYFYNAEQDKLTQADSSPIQSLSLSLTCRQVASEVRGLAFRTNTITFSTSHSQRTQEAAAVLHATVGEVMHQKHIMIYSLVSQLLTRDMAELAAKAYPQFASVFDDWTPQSDIPILYRKNFHCGEAPSVWIDFKHHILDLMSKHPLFGKRASAITRLWGPDIEYYTLQANDASSRPYFIPGFIHDVLKLVSKHVLAVTRALIIPRLWGSDSVCRATQLTRTSPKPWVIPDPVELKRLAHIVDVEPTLPFYEPKTKYTYSAASNALRFLRTLPDALRSEIRSLTLLEDHESVAYAKCHGRGFIGLCQSNPKLRVKRVVSLWQNAFPVTPEKKMDYILASQYPEYMYNVVSDPLLSKHISKALGAWMAETMALPSLGMPEGSYRLVFDGAPTLQHTSDVFKVVQRDIAWQSALDEAYSRGLLPAPSWLERRLRVGYLYEGLPNFVQKLSDEESLITCNFDPGLPFDVAEMLEEHRTWTMSDWTRNWDTHEPREYETEAPLAPWHTIRYQRIFD
ncbi:hypothetical protein J4E93_010785 [Alternaria ventricosa]|uniref:uncharacterized protein n=1 Tax=Alternaria ventricosa TaxID=1187951 RepID=UPI0020C36BDE|nr:uncharacterized protein J4E93_010785 [Alternaria ventricosa]KAI4636994.1 hypothetical protein J4E93_010785 [Alternaria ventricosa]